MGLRSRMLRLGTRLLESLVSSRRSQSAHNHSCRVCVAEQAIRADDQSICASHLLTHLDSLKPAVALDASSFLSRSSSTSTSSTLSSTYSSLSSRPATPIPARESQPHLPSASAYSFACKHTASTEQRQTTTVSMDTPTREPCVVECSSLVRALQMALGTLRYAISGQLAVQIQASRVPAARAGTSDACNEMLAISHVSDASWPSIVCPRSTRDVLPSWAAASRGHFTFGPDITVSTTTATSSLRINVNGTPTRVHIDWVDDEQFHCAPYVVEELATDCSFGSVPVLSVPSLMSLASLAAGRCTVDGSKPVQLFLTKRAFSGTRQNTVRRKPLPAGSLCKPLPSIPTASSLV